jgi:tRNA A-37 threonylcarbamoyl transferase component Bud32
MTLGQDGRYRVEAQLGRGGFGEAYRAYDTRLERRCVVKRLIVHPSLTPDERQHILRNFEREARLLVALNAPGHPNIPEIYEYLPESQCLVMKYIEGQSLAQLLENRGDPLPIETALRYARDVCAALVYMHSRTPEPVLHRDVKPANILLDATGRVWLIDFGLAKASPVQLQLVDRQVTQVAGTLGYTPPEQWQAAAVPRSDVYALAATLYMLLTNAHLDQAQLQAMIRGEGGPPPAGQLNPAVNPAVEQLIQRALAFDTTARPSAQEFLAELDALIAQLAIEPPAEMERPPEEPDFVGRAAELVALATQLATSGLAVIVGLAGVGKTALATTLAGQTEDTHRIFWHTFHKDEGSDVIIWELAAFLARPGRAGLWQQLHSAGHMGGATRPPEVLGDYLIQLVRGQDYLLCFDDFHFVDDDPQMARLIGRLINAAQAGQLALIVASRSMPRFAPAGMFTPLAGLSAADARSLLARRKLALPEDLTDMLVRSTEGNAQVLTLAIEALRHAPDRGAMIGRLAEAENIAEYLLREVDEGLTERERAVMGAVAALLGYAGTRAAVEALLGGGSAYRTLADLSRRNLLSASAGRRDKEYSQHAFVQAFYYRVLGEDERVVMHRRAGAYYEQVEPDALKAA